MDLRFGGVNPIDRYIAEGRVNPDGPLPRTCGGEAAGTIAGQPVLVAGAGLGTTRDGVWAQAANVLRDAVVAVPEGVELAAAAAMGIAGLEASLRAVQTGELRVRVDAVLALEDVNEALARLVQRRVQGKLLLDLG